MRMPGCRVPTGTTQPDCIVRHVAGSVPKPAPAPRSAMLDRPKRLTELAHGGGCGCKLAPAVLQKLLANQPAMGGFSQLLVGTETADDAAVWQVDETTCVI